MPRRGDVVQWCKADRTWQMQVSGDEPHQVGDRRGLVQALPDVRSSWTLYEALLQPLFPMTPQCYQ